MLRRKMGDEVTPKETDKQKTNYEKHPREKW